VSKLLSHVGFYREHVGLKQQDVAERIGISRQALSAIEHGRQVPNTAVALKLARILGRPVDELFALDDPADLDVTLGPGAAHAERLVVAQVDDRYVAHPLSLDSRHAADALLLQAEGQQGTARPIHADRDRMNANVLVAGCAPLIGALAQHLHSDTARAVWLRAGSLEALTLLQHDLVHVAGLHLGMSDDNAATVQEMFPHQRMLLVELTRWQQGLVVAKGNPRGITSGADLLQPDLRFAHRDMSSAAFKLLHALLHEAGAPDHTLQGPAAFGHMDVAALVACGAADVGIAIEPAALALGLDFVPLTYETFELVVPASRTAEPKVRRLLDTLDARGFKTDATHLPGYHASHCGEVFTLDAHIELA